MINLPKQPENLRKSFNQLEPKKNHKNSKYKEKMKQTFLHIFPKECIRKKRVQHKRRSFERKNTLTVIFCDKPNVCNSKTEWECFLYLNKNTLSKNYNQQILGSTGQKYSNRMKYGNFSSFSFVIQLELESYKYFISLMIINQLLTRLEKIENNRELLRKTCKLNQLPITMLNGFTNSKIQLIYERLLKHYQDHPDKAKTIWFQNELKIFFWIVLSISLFQNKKIRDFEDGQWLLIQNFFFKKDLYTFKYEAKKVLSSGRKNSRVWNAQENKLLKKIMSDSNLKNKWNEVARVFYSQSDHKYFRTGKQCRQHWLNHLDPSKKHGKWTDQEDLQILKYVFQNGKKWSLIAKELMTHRTQHMIKNRYKAVLFKEKRNFVPNEHDQNKILKKIIRKLSKKEATGEDQNMKDLCQKERQVRFQTQIEIEQGQKIVEKSVLQTNGQTPLNNFNLPNTSQWFCIWAHPLQMMTTINGMSPFYNPIYQPNEMSLIPINQKKEYFSQCNGLKVKSLPSQETSINVQRQGMEN